MRLPRRLLVRKRLLRHLLILLVPYLPVLPARRRRPQVTLRSAASSVRAASSRFAAVACSLTRRAVLPLPLLHRVLGHSIRWLRLRLLRASRFSSSRCSPSLFSLNALSACRLLSLHILLRHLWLPLSR